MPRKPEPPAPFLRKIGPTPREAWASVHQPDEREGYTETLCGLKLEGVELEGWARLPLEHKSCETCLRIRTERDGAPAQGEEAAEPQAPA
jgi:hypothetical protein